MKFLALDIETTGLAKISEILQIAAIFVEPSKPDKEFNCLIKPRPFGYTEIPALVMNHKIFCELNKPSGKISIYEREEAIEKFEIFLRGLNQEKITVAGKNVAGFDLPILEYNGFATNMFHHRVLDVGSLWLPDFQKIPSLTEINTKIGRPAVSHDALDDCRDVIAAVRNKIG